MLFCFLLQTCFFLILSYLLSDDSSEKWGTTKTHLEINYMLIYGKIVQEFTIVALETNWLVDTATLCLHIL